MPMERKDMKDDKQMNKDNHHSGNQQKTFQAQETKPEIKQSSTQEPQKMASVTEGTQNEIRVKAATDQQPSNPEKTDSTKTKADSTEAKEKRPNMISLKDKSELFKKIIDIAIACEALISDKKRLKEKNANLAKTCRSLIEDKNILIQQLKESETRYKAKLDEISELKADVASRDEAIGIIKADKTESAQEYKNALAASLRSLYTDFTELKAMGTSDDVGLAVIEIFEGVLKVLEKNGIIVGE